MEMGASSRLGLETVLMQAGANHAFECPALQDPGVQRRVQVCTASGVHVLSIPGYIIGQIIGCE